MKNPFSVGQAQGTRKKSPARFLEHNDLGAVAVGLVILTNMVLSYNLVTAFFITAVFPLVTLLVAALIATFCLGVGVCISCVTLCGLPDLKAFEGAEGLERLSGLLPLKVRERFFLPAYYDEKGNYLRQLRACSKLNSRPVLRLRFRARVMLMIGQCLTAVIIDALEYVGRLFIG